MKRFNTLFLSIIIGTSLLLSACVKTVNHSETTHVRNLAQSDVFTILPDNSSGVSIYNNSDEIQGEYLELASVMVSMKEPGENPDKTALIEKIKQEADLLGANGVLIVETKNLQEDKQSKVQVKGIAIFRLDEIPQEKDQSLASLPI